jgi:cyclopropane fatty-acyl-phospholipid synthase-like methyltransferase
MRINRVIDFGCGTGHLTQFLPKHVQYIGLDCLPFYVEKAKKTYPDFYFKDVRKDRLEDVKNFAPRTTFSSKVTLLVALGTFSYKEKEDTNYSENFRRSLLELSRAYPKMIVTFYCDTAEVKHDHLHYENLESFMKFCSQAFKSALFTEILPKNIMVFIEN